VTTERHFLRKPKTPVEASPRLASGHRHAAEFLTLSRITAEITSLAFYLLAAIGSIAIGLGLFSSLRQNPCVLIYLVFYIGFDIADRAVRPAFDTKADHDRTPACKLNSALMLALFAAAPFERHYLRGGEPPIVLSVIGLLAELAGLSLALGARIQLGRFGTPHLTVQEDQIVVRNALYSRIRHPIYAGGILSRQSWALVWGAPIVLLVGALADLLLIGWRIKTEEAMMLDRFGEPYNYYVLQTHRLIPGVW
jgi:protein-S-isoprenylcysteine O-methyltransferase Ste14